jgi:hypothetical protein
MSGGNAGKGGNLESLGNRALFDDGAKRRKPGGNWRKPLFAGSAHLQVRSWLERATPWRICVDHTAHERHWSGALPAKIMRKRLGRSAFIAGSAPLRGAQHHSVILSVAKDLMAIATDVLVELP